MARDCEGTLPLDEVANIVPLWSSSSTLHHMPATPLHCCRWEKAGSWTWRRRGQPIQFRLSAQFAHGPPPFSVLQMRQAGERGSSRRACCCTICRTSRSGTRRSHWLPHTATAACHTPPPGPTPLRTRRTAAPQTETPRSQHSSCAGFRVLLPSFIPTRKCSLRQGGGIPKTWGEGEENAVPEMRCLRMGQATYASLGNALGRSGQPHFPDTHAAPAQSAAELHWVPAGWWRSQRGTACRWTRMQL